LYHQPAAFTEESIDPLMASTSMLGDSAVGVALIWICRRSKLDPTDLRATLRHPATRNGGKAPRMASCGRAMLDEACSQSQTFPGFESSSLMARKAA
jgi:hypothetical protein